MPHANKRIDQGSLDDPVSSSRPHSWTKYGGGPETTEGHRGAVSDVEVTVDDVTVVHTSPEAESKYMLRGTSAHDAPEDEPEAPIPGVEVVKEWRVDRRVEGRTYRRTDELVVVELKG